MKKPSFRSIITLTLLLVVSIISFACFRIFSGLMEKRIYSYSNENLYSAIISLDLLKDQFYYSIEEHDGKIIGSLIQRLDQQPHVLNAYLYDGKGELKYSLNKEPEKTAPLNWDELVASGEEVGFKTYPSGNGHFSRAHLRMENNASCFGCHAPENKVLGFIVIDMLMNDPTENIAYIRNWSILFTFFMVVVIITFILFMHYRFVQRSLRDFNTTINSINQGDLNSRLSIPETKELGRLGRNFNSMVDTFQKAQNELQEYHKKELRSNYKLASIGELSARIAHEIRNPITGIANATEIIVNSTDDQQNKSILEEIQRQAHRVNNAISDLLDYSRKRELNLTMNHINEVVRQIVFFLENQIHHKDIVFQLDLDDKLPHFRFDPEQIEDVLLNLGMNAIQAIPRKGSVTFNTSFNPAENKAYVYVIDNGTGIPEKDKSRVFHPFFTRRSEGTGLGLSIVKDVIDKHEGEIWVENNSEGGCTFILSLPTEL